MIPKELKGMLGQSEAAALAVLAARVRRNGEGLDPTTKEAEEFLRDLEGLACESIRDNDGNVVHWIGVAARQMNPLLS